MISVENLYWILYDNLLKPLEIDCWYYYPFGTKDNLSCQGEFKKWQPKQEHHVLFHFDQEPLWQNDMGIIYDSRPEPWSNQIIKILANSEHSLIKQKICTNRGFLDWYYFYHGFAALDWYRDAQFVTTDHSIQNAFLSLNHLVRNQRSYRLALISKLVSLGVQHKGSISLHISLADIKQELDDAHTLLSSANRDCIKGNLDHFGDIPWTLDNIPINSEMSARFGHQELCLWQQSLFHIVNETVFYHPKLHLTEKTFKPVVAGRPFILVAAPGNLAYLKSYGFKTFDRWVDETYDTILDHDKRLDAIAQQIARIAVLPRSQLQTLYLEMKPVLEYNKQHFFSTFRTMIVDELIHNFEICIRIWNHARLDGREIKTPSNLVSVRERLLG